MVAMDVVRRRVLDTLLSIADGELLEGALRSLVRSLRLENNVRLLELIPARHKNLPMAYRAAGLTMVPSLSVLWCC